MKKAILLLFVLLLSTEFASGAGIGINVGGGYYNYLLTDVSPYVSKDGASAIFALEIPLDESNIFEIEGAFIKFWRKEKELGTYKNKSYLTPFYGLRIYLFDYQKTFRPSVHLGASTIPFVSWNAGIALDYKIYKDAHLQLSSWFVFDGLVQLAGDDNPPQFLILSFKYYLK